MPSNPTTTTAAEREELRRLFKYYETDEGSWLGRFTREMLPRLLADAEERDRLQVDLHATERAYEDLIKAIEADRDRLIAEVDKLKGLTNP